MLSEESDSKAHKETQQGPELGIVMIGLSSMRWTDLNSSYRLVYHIIERVDRKSNVDCTCKSIYTEETCTCLVHVKYRVDCKDWRYEVCAHDGCSISQTVGAQVRPIMQRKKQYHEDDSSQNVLQNVPLVDVDCYENENKYCDERSAAEKQ